jgi:exopolysaccharide biosynthesis protein
MTKTQKFSLRKREKFVVYGAFLLSLILTAFIFYKTQQDYLAIIKSQTIREQNLNVQLKHVKKDLDDTTIAYENLKKVDQKVKNDKLEEEINNIQKTYGQLVTTYERLLKLKELTNKTADQDKAYAQAITMLSDRNYASAEAVLGQLQTDIQKKQAEIAASFQIPANVPQNNTAPTNGYQQQVVKTQYGEYLVSVVAADLNSTRVIVDTASDGTCKNDCPVDSLASYAGRSGAFAGINGPYFCPADYPSCADKKNSFDTLLMNKNKTYFNSENNVYSTVPAAIFSAGSARFVGASQEWGRDTGPDSVIASQPMLVAGGNVVYGGDDEIKRAGKGTRAFIGATGSTAYIGVVYNANVAEVAQVLKTMGIQSALNLDSGGSTAFWVNGRYVAGPGRNTPFGILFVRR